MDPQKKRSRDSCTESLLENEKKERRYRQQKPAVKSAPPDRCIIDENAKFMDFSHVPCKDSILGFETELLEYMYDTGKVIRRVKLGIVSQIFRIKTLKLYACKSINKKDYLPKYGKDGIPREIEITATLQGCPHIVSFESVHEDENWIHLVMEHCPGGKLFDEINRVCSFSESVSAQIFHQIVQGVFHYHSRCILHHDLKPKNILIANVPFGPVSEFPTIKLADFGLAKALPPSGVIRGASGTTLYMVPEVWDGMHGLPANIWSLGVILYALLSGHLPYKGEDDFSTYEAIVDNELEFDGPEWADFSEEAKFFIRQILHSDPSGRPIAYDLLCHPWVTRYVNPTSSSSKPSSEPSSETSSEPSSPELNIEPTNFVSSPSDCEFKTHTNSLQVQAHSSIGFNLPLMKIKIYLNINIQIRLIKMLKLSLQELK